MGACVQFRDSEQRKHTGRILHVTVDIAVAKTNGKHKIYTVPLSALEVEPHDKREMSELWGEQ